MDELKSDGNPYVPPSAPRLDELSWESSAAPIRQARGFDVKLYFWLLAASLLGTLAILPYSYTLMKQADPPLLPEALLPLALGATVVIELLISAAAIGLGLALGPHVGLGLMSVPDLPTDEPSRGRRLWASTGQPLVIGMAMGVIMGVFASKLDVSAAGKHPNLTIPSPGEGLLASVGAGIREEIWLRLGFMTFLVWVGISLIRPFTKLNSEAPAAVVWIGNLLAAVCFAAIHIPQASALLGLTAPLLVFILVGNGLPGLIFGWLYWRRGLYAAMLAHFGLDLVLKVFMPLLS